MTKNKCPYCPKERPFSRKYSKERNKTCGSKECISKHLTKVAQGRSKTSSWNNRW